MDINAKTLISLVEERPVLWDRTDGEYKDKQLKLAAWREVCLVLKPNFGELLEKERKQYGKLVVHKWYNIRDSWIKTVKKQKDESKSGSPARKTHNYVYHEQLMFLKKVTDPRPTDESVSKRARNDPEEGMMGPSSIGSTEFLSPSSKEKRGTDKEVNEKMVTFLESRMDPEKENHHLSFFKGIIPSLNTLSVDETLEFQTTVLTLIQSIRRKNYERQDYGPRRDSPYVQITGHGQHYSRHYTNYDSTNHPTTSTQDEHVHGYSAHYNFSNQLATTPTSIPTASQSRNAIPASPAASSMNSVNSEDSDSYLDVEEL